MNEISCQEQRTRRLIPRTHGENLPIGGGDEQRRQAGSAPRKRCMDHQMRGTRPIDYRDGEPADRQQRNVEIRACRRSVESR